MIPTMEYEVVHEHGALTFFQKKDIDESASQYEEEEEEDETVELENTYFLFEVPLEGVRRVAPGYYKAGVNEIILRDTNEAGDTEYSVKIYKANEYTFKLELTEETFNETVSILQKAAPKKGGRKTRRGLSLKKH
jgi:hypothetical protein